MHPLAHFLRELRQDLFGFDDADLLLHGLELVDPHVGEYMQAGFRLALQALFQTLEELCTVIKKRSRVPLQGIVHECGRFPLRAVRQHDPDADARGAVEVDALELQFQRVTVCDLDRGFDLELFVVRPLAFDRGVEGTFEGGVTLGFEIVHHREAPDLVQVRCLEQAEPGFIRLDQDAFLHQRDRRR